MTNNEILDRLRNLAPHLPHDKLTELTELTEAIGDRLVQPLPRLYRWIIPETYATEDNYLGGEAIAIATSLEAAIEAIRNNFDEGEEANEALRRSLTEESPDDIWDAPHGYYQEGEG